MQAQNETREKVLALLFDAELSFKEDVDPVVSAQDMEGVLIGSGDGSVTGEKVNGTIRWSFYTGNCAYVFVQAGIEPPPGQHLCTTNPGGVIETDNGAEIWFNARGYGLRGADASQPHIWRLTMAIEFKTVDERYQGMNTTLGVLVSEFDESVGRAHWWIYAPSDQ